LGLSLVVGALGFFVSSLEETIDQPTHCFCFLRSEVTRFGCISEILSGPQRHRLPALRNTPCTHPPRLSDPTFRVQRIHIRSGLPLTSNADNRTGILSEPTSHGRGPHGGQIMAPVGAGGDLFSATTTFLTGTPLPLRIFGLGLATGSSRCGSFTHRRETRADDRAVGMVRRKGATDKYNGEGRQETGGCGSRETRKRHPAIPEFSSEADQGWKPRCQMWESHPPFSASCPSTKNTRIYAIKSSVRTSKCRDTIYVRVQNTLGNQRIEDERNDHLALRSCYGISCSHVQSCPLLLVHCFDDEQPQEVPQTTRKWLGHLFPGGDTIKAEVRWSLRFW